MTTVSREANCFTNEINQQLEQKAAGRRKLVRHGGKLCCRCHERPPTSQTDRYCHECRKQYMADWRARTGVKNARNAAIAESVLAAIGDEQKAKMLKGLEHGQVEKAKPAAAEQRQGPPITRV